MEPLFDERPVAGRGYTSPAFMNEKAEQKSTLQLTNEYKVDRELTIREHFIKVPLDLQSTTTLKLFVRTAHTGTYENSILYLQGGPGMSCPLPSYSGMTKELVSRGYRVVFLDQRGTGFSSAVVSATLEEISHNPKELCDYLTNFRADSIVRDCELVRQALNLDKWSIIGQSFGGFCALTYLSVAQSSLTEVFITGGLAPILRKDPDKIYTRLFRRAIARNDAYYEKYPGDVNVVKRLCLWLLLQENGYVALPSGGRLTPNRVQELGICLGGHGGVDKLHRKYCALRVNSRNYDGV